MSLRRIVMSGVAIFAVVLTFALYKYTAQANGILQSDLKISLDKVGEGFALPVLLTNAGDGSGRIFVVEKAGKIQILKDGKPAAKPFLDITSHVESAANERGLLGLAFHPNYKTNGLFYVYYTAPSGTLTIAQYKVSATDPDEADPKSAKVLLKVNHARENHNGGMLAFGPDGYLYFGMGDGGGGGDPDANGQNPKTLLGKLNRIDVDHGDPYAIPADNPFADGKKGAKEVWAYGLRNPWRFSFDRQTGDLWIADVGQNMYEEIDFQPAKTPGGLNYGWNTMEGLHCYSNASCDQSGITLPVLEYSHDGGNCSETGGYVYRGKVSPNLQGYYFFGDFCSGRVWITQPPASGPWTMAQILHENKNISAFGEDEAGELYLLEYGRGAIFHIVDETTK